ncbi:group XIIB secretory phospholipase A2 isoform X2 [Chlorella sorokiniana]|uniref:Group XIIB secretory phospholipase A2 isoform X2 n=1 Tax=Chlorella sorokiniana TaxID=3076 RepID=A0A2P6TS65_CHLSO|nr:group XIIB secretory phospholipase A2 isoform X2 [Chlorella sorokiniana]|eukprot:PRW56911.1 group XIIB secretory phospholipase A2 isoform X2 [Chlorella sorokiniana]
MGCRPVLAAPLLLLLLALGGGLAQADTCPGYFDQGQGAARLSFEATVPPEHLQDIFTPQRFSELLGQLVDGLPLEVLSVQTNVTIGGYGQLWRFR